MIQKVEKHKSVSAKTANILYRVLAYMEKEKNRVDMYSWGRFCTTPTIETGNSIDGWRVQTSPPCRTTACIAGAVLLVTKPGRKILKDTGFFSGKAEFPYNSDDIAGDIAAIRPDRRPLLFYFDSWGMDGGGWPLQFEKKYKRAKTGAGRFAAVKARVLHFIRTGE